MSPPSLVAMYRATRLRFGEGLESCNVNGPRNIRPVLFRHFSLLIIRNRSWKCPNEGKQFYTAICVTPKRCDSCALGKRTVSCRNLCDAESLCSAAAKRARVVGKKRALIFQPPKNNYTKSWLNGPKTPEKCFWMPQTSTFSYAVAATGLLLPGSCFTPPPPKKKLWLQITIG